MTCCQRYRPIRGSDPSHGSWRPFQSQGMAWAVHQGNWARFNQLEWFQLSSFLLYSWLILCVLVFTEIIYQKSSTRRAFKLNIYHFHLEICFLHKSVKKKRRPASSFGSMAITLAAISASFWWWSAKAMSRCLEIIFLESLLRKQVPGHFRCCRWHRERLT